MPLPVSSPRNPVVNDFPLQARIALAYVFDDLRDKGYLTSEESVIRELNRVGRFSSVEVGEETADENFLSRIERRLQLLEWDQVLLFCERTYTKLLTGVDFYDFYVGLEEVQQYFEQEVNQILDEENIAFHFRDGKFQRKGHAHTWRSFEGMGKVLAQRRFDKVRGFYNKARYFFNQRPESDVENCVKESLCALEACLEVVTGEVASKNFDKVVKSRMGNGPEKIPPPIAEGMIKLHAYRGSGRGVSHAASRGNRVTLAEAELVLNLTAAYITYLADLYPEEIPF